MKELLARGGGDRKEVAEVQENGKDNINLSRWTLCIVAVAILIYFWIGYCLYLFHSYPFDS